MLNISHKQTTAYHPESNGAHAAAATWFKELPFVLLGLRAQPREDTGLSLAEAVFGAQIVLPNEFLQNDELSVDTIVITFSKTLHVSAPSLPRHNSSTDLPSELPAELLSAPLVWVRRGGLLPPLQPLYNSPTRSCAAALAPSPSESGHGTRWLASAAWLWTPRLAARVATADRWACAQAVLPQPRGSRFQTRWSLHLPLLRCRHDTVPELFSYPPRRFLHAQDQRHLHSLHRRGTRLVNGHRHRG
jgi:hypothetical protein